MTNDIRLAFAHPLERAEATAGNDPRDRISLRDHVREVEIGAFQAERGTRQRLRFNIVVEVVPTPRQIDDDVDKILSYDTLVEAIDTELSAERLNLLETLAERVAARILLAPLAARVFVRIEKLDRGPGALGVEIVRSRAQAAVHLVEDGPASAIARPVIVHLGNAAIAAPALAGWLDRIEAAGRPAILTVGLPDGPRPRAATPAAQRRIDLLAIEQNAWVLAGRDPRCVVVDSRTELDWAIKHDAISVWAPSRIVLDSREAELPPVSDPAGLAAWLGQKFDATELLLVDAPRPGWPGSELALRHVSLTEDPGL